MTTIIHKRGKGIPEADKFESVGEILIDTVEGVGYTLTDDGEVSAVGGDSIWNEVPQPNSKDYRWVTLKDQSTGDDEYGFRIQYCTRVEDPDNPDPDFPNGPWDNAELRIREINAKKSDIATVNAINLDAVDAKVVEQQVLGGIQILGANQERPDELPDKTADGKSIQYALTVFHETLGRSVVIDKEGIIRASDFTDLDGNSIIGAGGGGDPEWALVGSDQEYEKVIAFGAPSDTTIVDQECIAIGFECEAMYRSVAIGHGSEAGDEGIALGRNAEAGPEEFAISPNIDSVNFSNARVQAQDYLDADGNSIVNKQQVLTQSEYDSLTPDPDTVYFII